MLDQKFSDNMGGCCSTDHNGIRRPGGLWGDDFDENEFEEEEDEDDLRDGESGARIRLRDSSGYTSMYTQQGRKGINQDAMTVWENFTCEKDMLLCGVFDGHGPHGHKVAHHVRDNLPIKLSRAIELSKLNSFKYGDVDVADKDLFDDYGEADHDHGNSITNTDHDHDNVNKDDNQNDKSLRVLSLSSWEACLIKSFTEMDEELGLDSSIDSFCSGSTAVTVVKQGDNLIIANLGDSRAILCTRGDKNQLVPVQLTVDLKPDIASEAERIKRCQGRVFAADEEPDVHRIWMPEDDCPGLAMARAFGDFCLKDYGLISIPEIFFRRLTKDDEFVVLATDGVWDALTNAEVVKIVASARKRSTAARLLVKRAVRAWKIKYPGCKVDDCAVVCLFFKDQTLLAKSSSHVTNRSSINASEFSLCRSFKSFRSVGAPEYLEGDNVVSRDHESWNALQGISRVNSIVKLPQFLSFRRSTSDLREVEAR